MNHLNRRIDQSTSAMVDPPADLPDLAVGPRERRDVAHVNHRLRKVLEEDVLVCGVELDELGGGGAVGEENLVGGEQAAVREQVLVVLVVELEGGHGVQEEEVLVAAGARATLAQRRRVGRVQLVVREAVAGLVVQALAEAGAPRVADGVATCRLSSELPSIITMHIYLVWFACVDESPLQIVIANVVGDTPPARMCSLLLCRGRI
jgi:hypothetical protein